MTLLSLSGHYQMCCPFSEVNSTEPGSTSAVNAYPAAVHVSAIHGRPVAEPRHPIRLAAVRPPALRLGKLTDMLDEEPGAQLPALASGPDPPAPRVRRVRRVLGDGAEAGVPPPAPRLPSLGPGQGTLAVQSLPPIVSDR
jgi:hypothetical protein